jgi:cytochrome c-type biogenesis protein CcmF
VLRLRYKVDPQLFGLRFGIIAAVQVFFLLLINFAANPFGLVSGTDPRRRQRPQSAAAISRDGHPSANALSRLRRRHRAVRLRAGRADHEVSRREVDHITRRWTMVAWLFLTCGIFLGAHWAYAVLGWGGYWGWDPVENASLLPWLTMTAFLHSVMMQEKRGMMKMWNMWLIFTTFLLAIFGTFLTRSGVVSSVHAFAQSSIGTWFVWFLAIIFSTCVFFFVRNRETLKSEHIAGVAGLARVQLPVQQSGAASARASPCCGARCFRCFRSGVTGSKVTVGPPFFNRVNVPIGILPGVTDRQSARCWPGARHRSIG